ncbi:MAG: ABC transporter ATP-binding protein [Anaerolineae bacterium]
MSEVILSLRGVRVQYGAKLILDVPSLDVRAREILAIIGPNGAGKSTLLHVAAGLLAPQEGTLSFRGQRVDAGQLAYRRHVALVLQEPVLLDLSVLANVTLCLRFRRLSKREAQERALAWLERLGVAHLARQPARTLSGGEAQRVSLARALALNPQLLLLDEPFSSLDAPTRAELLEDLGYLLRGIGVATVFVTHDQNEALQLGDRLAVLLGGRIRQLGVPGQVFAAPADEEVAAFVGVETILPGRIAAFVDGLSLVEIGLQHLEVVAEGEIGDEVWVCLRPEDVTLTPAEAPPGASSARNRFRGRVVRVVPQGRLYTVSVDCGFRLTAAITPRSVRELELAEGREVVAAFKATAAHVIRRGRRADRAVHRRDAEDAEKKE